MASTYWQIACAITWNILAAGPIFGFSALKPVLVSQGVYGELCEADQPGCAAQDMKLNFMFTIAAGVTNVVALIVGIVLDTRGPRVCGFVGSAFLAAGSLLFAFNSSVPLVDPYLLGYSCLAIGGPFVFISTFQLANAIPKHSGKILSAITGAFDSSSALFLFYRLYYQNVKPLGVETFFLGYLVVPVFIVLCQIFVMPRDSYRSWGAVRKLNVEGLDENGNLPEGMSGQALTGDEREREELLHQHMSTSHLPTSAERRGSRRVSCVSYQRRKSVLEEHVGQQLEAKTQGVYGVLHGQSSSTQIKSPWFVNALILTILCMLRLNYFMATVRSLEDYLVGGAAGKSLGDTFDAVLPLGGLIAIPATGLLLDNLPTITVLKIMCTTSVLIGVLGLFHSYYLNLLGILILVVYRPFYYTVISDYSAKVFGFETFGTVYGLLMSVAGCFNMAQTIVDRLTHTVFKMNPTPLNFLMTLATAVASISLIRYATTEVEKRQGQPSTDPGRPTSHRPLHERSALLESAILEDEA